MVEFHQDLTTESAVIEGQATDEQKDNNILRKEPISPEIFFFQKIYNFEKYIWAYA